jgi:hypothetical protein
MAAHVSFLRTAPVHWRCLERSNSCSTAVAALQLSSAVSLQSAAQYEALTWKLALVVTLAILSS